MPANHEITTDGGITVHKPLTHSNSFLQYFQKNNKQVHRRGTTSSSRASSRKSSRASDGSDLSELTGPWMNLPLMLLPGTGDLVKDLKPTG